MKRITLQDVQKPNLLREMYPYKEFPRLVFEDQTAPGEIPESIWLTDTTFRDGQQARAPYTPQQILKMYDYLHRIDGGGGLIRQSEFFLYSERDREAVDLCKARGYRFPEITGWIRSKPSDLEYVKKAGLKEVGILASVSDYHIFYKLKQTRQQALDHYLNMMRLALEQGLQPRCHLEDVTRADFDGFVLPLADALMALSDESGVPIKIRLCDTLGMGVPYPHVIVPRSIPKMMQALRSLGVPSAQLEWHGHNDFHKGAVNAASAWLYGCASVNCTLFGMGERTGNPPLEALLVEYAQIKGAPPHVDYAVISELAEYAQKELGFAIPHHYPLVGRDAHVTCAGIHADGMLKHQEIYNGYDTETLLQRQPSVAITDRSGIAGILHWIKTHFALDISKQDPRLQRIKHWIEGQYTKSRSSVISDAEMFAWVSVLFKDDLTGSTYSHST